MQQNKITNEELASYNDELEASFAELEAALAEQVKARQELEQLNRLKDDFLSLASHELRTPLTAILGMAELLQLVMQQQEAESSFQDTHLWKGRLPLDPVNRILFQANRMAKLISEMLDVARIHADMFELTARKQINIVDLVQRVVEQLAALTPRPIILETSQETLVGTCDEARIEQVLNNMISNALKYSPPQMEVVVALQCQQTRALSHEVIISVRDKGCGISAEHQAHIFDRFYRVHTRENTSVEGLGLGLYIAHEIITRHGGRMRLESTVGVGSTFYVSLPLEEK